eukprot:13553965-Alexandrium_andersonii.AAC.1
MLFCKAAVFAGSAGGGTALPAASLVTAGRMRAAGSLSVPSLAVVSMLAAGRFTSVPLPAGFLNTESLGAIL